MLLALTWSVFVLWPGQLKKIGALLFLFPQLVDCLLSATSQRRNTPFSFRFFQTEAERFAAATELLDEVEDQREYFGLDLGRLMCVVKEAKKYVSLERQGQNLTEKVQNTHVSEWLAAKVKWSDPKRCPSAATVGQLLQIASSLSHASKAQAAMALARAHFGRATLFDEYSKVLILCQRSTTSEDLDFLAEFLAVKALRTNNAESLGFVLSEVW